MLSYVVSYNVTRCNKKKTVHSQQCSQIKCNLLLTNKLKLTVLVHGGGQPQEDPDLASPSMQTSNGGDVNV